MGGGNESPRQKMIGMMYLVLTALLALNVSKSILTAFVVVADTLEETNLIFTQKNDATYNKFQSNYEFNKEKVGKFWNSAQLARTKTQEFVDYINEVKVEIIMLTDGILEKSIADTMSAKDIQSKDNYDIPTNYFCGQEVDGVGEKATEIKQKIEEYKSEMRELLGDEGKNFSMGLVTDGDYRDKDGMEVTWESKNFYSIVVVANICILNNIIGGIRNIEAGVVKKLFSQVSAEDFKFDKIVAKVVPKSNYVMKGEKYEADIFVAAYDSKKDPVIVMGRVDTSSSSNPVIKGRTEKLEEVSDGVGKYTRIASSIGPQKYSGLVKIAKSPGDTASYEFFSEYMVAVPSLTVSATKMNVFYIGVDNPVSISVPGVASADLNAQTIGCGCVLTKKPDGTYNVTCKKKGKTNIIVSAKFDGKAKAMGKVEFRVKEVPDPVPMIAGKKGGMIKKSALLASGGTILAKLENFDFDLKFRVVSFMFSANINGNLTEVKVRGMSFNSKINKLVKGLKKGEKLYLENIKAKGAGSTRTLPPINLKLL